MANYSMTGNVYTDKTDNVDTIFAAHVNDLQDEVELIEKTLLGTRADDLDLDGTFNANVLTSDGTITASGTITGATIVGANALYHNGVSTNTFSHARASVTTGQKNTGYGDDTLDVLTSGNYNSMFGYASGRLIEGANTNTGMGYNVFYSAVTGDANDAFGYQSLWTLNGGSYNSALGYQTLRSLTTGQYNLGIGHQAGFSMTDNVDNLAIGRQALYSAISGGDYNIAVGGTSLNTLTIGTRNVAIGYHSLFAVDTGEHNVAIGVHSGESALGSGNVFLGYASGANEAGSNKLYIANSDTATPLIYGDFSTNALTINGSLEVTGAYKGILANQSGGATNRTSDDLSATMTGTDNAIYGYQAGDAITSSDQNSGFGRNALTSLTTGNYNTAVGATSGGSIETGNGNTCLGRYSLGQVEASQSSNVAIGFESGRTATGSDNTLLGYQTGYAVDTRVVAIGSYAGRYEVGSDAFYVNNRNQIDTAHDKSNSLIYGIFSATVANQKLQFNCGWMGFYGTTSIAQAVLATGAGATVDNVITALQNLGLVKQA